MVSDAGQRARLEEERRAVESVKCLIGTRNGGSHRFLTLGVTLINIEK